MKHQNHLQWLGRSANEMVQVGSEQLRQEGAILVET